MRKIKSVSERIELMQSVSKEVITGVMETLKESDLNEAEQLFVLATLSVSLGKTLADRGYDLGPAESRIPA